MKSSCLAIACSVLTLAGCADEHVDSEAKTQVFELPEVRVDASSETDALCQSFTLDNDEPLYVNTVAMTATPGFHHSNWYFVPDSKFGEDGTFNCGDRGFSQLVAAVEGGVFFTQSTQATRDLQQFPEGAAIVVPPRSKVVGNLHLLNATDAPLVASMKLEVHTLSADEMRVALAPMALDYRPLDIPPMTRSRFSGSCEFTAANDGPMDFSIYYVLPHYHALGAGMRVSALRGETEQILFDDDSSIGEPLSKMLDPPVSLTGASRLTFSCDYINDRSESVGAGIGDQEMCIAVAFTDADVTFGGGVLSSNRLVGTDADGVSLNEGDCTVFSVPAPGR